MRHCQAISYAYDMESRMRTPKRPRLELLHRTVHSALGPDHPIPGCAWRPTTASTIRCAYLQVPFLLIWAVRLDTFVIALRSNRYIFASDSAGCCTQHGTRCRLTRKPCCRTVCLPSQRVTECRRSRPRDGTSSRILEADRPSRFTLSGVRLCSKESVGRGPGGSNDSESAAAVNQHPRNSRACLAEPF